MKHAERMVLLNSTEFSRLIAKHGKAIYSFCRKLAKTQADTDDLYQETFLKAMETAGKIDSQKNPKAYLLSIAIGIWQNNRRKYAWRQRIAPTEAYDEDRGEVQQTTEDAVLSRERIQRVQAAVDALDEKYRLPLYLYYTAELSIREIADMMRLPQGTVKSRLYKARSILKTDLEVDGF